MLNASYNLSKLDLKGIENVYYDFAQHQFVDSSTGGSPADFERYVSEARWNPDKVRGEGSAGITTAKRTALANTLLRARSEGARRLVFDRLATLSLDKLPGAERLLYQ